MIEQVRPSQLDDWLRQHAHERPLVLDVREPVELAMASVRPDGFELAHIPMHEIPSRLGELDSERAVACLCHHGMRSLQVAHFLTRNGFDEVANITGGIEAWSNERDPAVPRY